MNRNDADANIYFLKYVKNFKGKNYLKSACQRLSWYYMLNNDTATFKHFSNLIKTTGSKNVDEDKQAEKEIENQILPNRILLKSRLFFDGGYYNEALKYLATSDLKLIISTHDKLEYVYRLARIYDKLKNEELAIKNYLLSLKNGEHTTYYFSANAALQLGLLYEQKSDFANAKLYFQKCLSLKNHEYQNSIDAKAKAGLSRVLKRS